MNLDTLDLRCPECGRPLAVRTSRQNGSEFLGCTGYPDDCRHTQGIPEHVRLQQQGATPLPGLDL